MQPETASSPPGRLWASLSLAAGVLWLVLAMLPIPFTTLMGLPFSAYALVGGWLARRNQLRVGDALGARRAGWGVGLGCLGFVWLSVMYIILGGALVAGVLALLRQGTPAP